MDGTPRRQWATVYVSNVGSVHATLSRRNVTWPQSRRWLLCQTLTRLVQRLDAHGLGLFGGRDSEHCPALSRRGPRRRVLAAGHVPGRTMPRLTLVTFATTKHAKALILSTVDSQGDPRFSWLRWVRLPFVNRNATPSYTLSEYRPMDLRMALKDLAKHLPEWEASSAFAWQREQGRAVPDSSCAGQKQTAPAIPTRQTWSSAGVQVA